MCQIKSAIILKDRVFCPYDYDDHSKMLETLGIKDNSKDPQFVRVEMNPIDGDIFNHDLSNWKLKVDQDFKPDWFSEKFTEAEMKKELEKWWQERFIFNDKTRKNLKDGKFYVKNSSVEARENSSVVAWGNSQILLPYDYLVKIKGVYDNASVKDIAKGKIIVAKKFKQEIFKIGKVKK